MVHPILFEKSHKKLNKQSNESTINNDGVLPLNANQVTVSSDLNDTYHNINVFQLFEYVQKVGCKFSQKLSLFLPVIQFMVKFFYFMVII